MTHAVLTGHTRGLGAALAAELLGRGWRVLALARTPHAELGAQHAQALQQVELDLSDAGALSQWLAGDALRGFLSGAPRVLLLNNAGMLQPVGPLAAQDAGSVGRAVELNVAAPLMLAAAVAAQHRAEGDTRIVHVSSGAARTAYAGWSVYGATKAALDHHARCVAADAVPGLRICSLAPGVIDTQMQAEVRATPAERFPQRERFQTLHESGSLTSPEACAARLLGYALGEGFGELPVADLREVG